MFVLPEYNYPYQIHSIDDPVVIDYYWTFNAIIKDQVLSPVIYFEETSGNIISIKIKNYVLTLPSNWYIIVMDSHTSTIDTVTITEAITKAYEVVIISSLYAKYTYSKVTIDDYKITTPCVHPRIDKGHALIHPIGIDEKNPQSVWSVLIGPHDLYSHISDMTIKELII